LTKESERKESLRKESERRKIMESEMICLVV